VGVLHLAARMISNPMKKESFRLPMKKKLSF
jgi:hypothetical protein